MRIAVSQPYFIPYLSYFKLIAQTDLFIILDDAQHLRRGWFHRNKLSNHQGKPEWLTLPIKSCSRNTLIGQLEFADNADEMWEKNLRKFPLFDEFKDEREWELGGTPCNYIIKTMAAICDTLRVPFNTMRSSELDIPPGLKGRDRILAICEKFNAEEYVNAPGGKDLYSSDAFRLHGIKLKFLPEYENKKSMLERICFEKLGDLKRELYQ